MVANIFFKDTSFFSMLPSPSAIKKSKRETYNTPFNHIQHLQIDPLSSFHSPKSAVMFQFLELQLEIQNSLFLALDNVMPVE
jgi:hypothetical protein